MVQLMQLSTCIWNRYGVSYVSDKSFSYPACAVQAVSTPQEKVNADIEATRRGADKVGGEVKRAVNDPEAKVNSDLGAVSKQAKKFSIW